MGANILIAEDSPFAAETLIALLRKLGHKTALVEDANRIVPVFRQMKPDLMILDYVMPSGSSLDALNKIRYLDGGASTPVIFLTAKPAEEIQGAVGASPLVRILAKPPDKEELETAIGQLLASRAQKRP